MRFDLSITCQGEAFGESKADAAIEVARILHELADRLQSGGTDAKKLYDLNGNGVGLAQFIGSRS